jgi:hypothetical protein
MRLHSGAAVAPAPAPPDPPGPGPPGPPWGALGTSSRPSSWEAYHSSGFPPALAQHGPGERPCTARASRPPARGSRPGPARAAPARRRAAPAIKHVMCVICDTRVSLALRKTLYYTGLAQLRGEGAGAGAGDPVVREESSSSGAAHLRPTRGGEPGPGGWRWRNSATQAVAGLEMRGGKGRRESPGQMTG